MSPRPDAAVASVLRACIADLHVPERITTGALARDAEGEVLYRGQLDRAVCWCTIGLLHKHVDRDSECWRQAYLVLSHEITPNNLTHWHDHATPAERIRVFEAALASVECAA